MPSTSRIPTVKPDAGLFAAYDEIFAKESATLIGFSKNEVEAMHRLITKGEGGHLNQGRYYKPLFERFFRDRSWIWPEFEQWENASQHKEVYALLIRTLTSRASSLHHRRKEMALGITQAIWLHSGGGRTPRAEHVAFSGQKYEIAKGAFLEGKWTWPGVEIDCKCVSRAVIPGFT